jgi:SAM-dependent methyltransferase
MALLRDGPTSVIDAEAFRAFEKTGWDERAAAYERIFAAVSAHNVAPLLDAAAVRAGSRVLDAGCGPGELAAGAAARGASVIGTDLSPGMIALARRRHPELEFQQADAERLPFSDGTFDAVVANLLIPHLPRPEAGVEELTRVLKPGGRLAMSMWDRPERSRLVGVIWEAIAEVGAPPPAGIPPGPPPFRYADEDELARLFASAGLTEVSFRQIQFSHPVSNGEEIWKAWTEGSVRTASSVMGQPAELQRKIRAGFDRRVSAYATDRGVSVPVSFVIASGQRP